MANDEAHDGEQRPPRVGDLHPVPPPGSRLRHWLHRPRRPLGIRDLLPHGGGLFLPVFVTAALFCGGLLELFGSGPHFRVAGICALSGSATVTVLVVLHLRRPPHR